MSINRKNAIELYRLVLRLQLLVRSLTRSAPTRLGLSESQTLGEILLGRNVTATALASELHFSKSTLSRLLAGLISRGLVAEAHAEGGRSKALSLTALGMRELEKDDLARSSVSARLVAPLSEEEEVRLQEFFAAIADGLGAPQGKLRTGERGLRLQQRRLARVFGMLDDNIFGSEFSTTEYHILLSLLLSTEGSDLTSLSTLLPFDLSTLSRSVKKLEGEGYVKRDSSESDRRRILLKISDLGYDRLASVERDALAHLERAMESVPEEISSDGIELLARCVRNSGARKDVFGGDIHFSQLDGEERKRWARGLLIQRLARDERAFSAPSRLFAQSDFACALNKGGEVAAVLDLQLEGKHWVLNIFEVFDESIDTALRIHFLAEAMRGLAARHGARKVIVPPGVLPDEVLLAFPGAAPGESASLISIRPSVRNEERYHV